MKPQAFDCCGPLAEPGFLLTGHFVCISGLHTDRWIHKDRWFTDPRKLDALGEQLADKIRSAGLRPELLCGPATGGLLVGHAAARPLGCPVVFTEGEQRQQRLRRGYDRMVRGRRVVLVDDIANTGLTLRTAWQALSEAGAIIEGVAVLIQRGVVFGPWGRLLSLQDVELRSWTAEECPLCRQGEPVDASYGHG